MTTMATGVKPIWPVAASQREPAVGPGPITDHIANHRGDEATPKINHGLSATTNTDTAQYP